MTNRQNYAFDGNQPALIPAHRNNDGAILYMSAMPMHFFFSRGLLDYGAIYYPAIFGTSEEKKWLNDKKEQIQYIVNWHPVQSIRGPVQGKFPLDAGTHFEMTRRVPATPEPVAFWLENKGEKTTVGWVVHDAVSDERINVYQDVPARWTGWLNPTVSGGGDRDTGAHATRFDAIRLMDSGMKGTIFLKGIRTGSQHGELNWPWDKGIAVEYSRVADRVKPKIVTFQTDALYPNDLYMNSPQHVRLLADAGSTVLFAVDRSEP